MDDDAFLRTVNFPARGIGATTINKLVIAANDAGKSLWQIAEDPVAHKISIHGGSLRKVSEFIIMIKSFAARLYKLNAYELGELIVNKSGIRKLYFDDGTPESLNRRDNIEELLSGLKDFVMQPPDMLEETQEENTDNAPAAVPLTDKNLQQDDVVNNETYLRTLDEFMQDISLLTDADTKNENKENKTPVPLMTSMLPKVWSFPMSL